MVVVVVVVVTGCNVNSICWGATWRRSYSTSPSGFPPSCSLESFRQLSRPRFGLCILYCISIAHVFVCKERTWKRWKCIEKYCLAQQKAKHMTPKAAKKNPKPPKVKRNKIYENWNAQEDIEFDSIRKCCLTWRRVLFISLNCLRDKVYLTDSKSAIEKYIHLFCVCTEILAIRRARELKFGMKLTLYATQLEFISIIGCHAQCLRKSVICDYNRKSLNYKLLLWHAVRCLQDAAMLQILNKLEHKPRSYY